MLTGKRILLRAPEREDLKSFHKWQNDEELMMLSRSQPDQVKSMVSVEAEFEKDLKGEDAEVRRYTIEEKSSKKAIGWCSIRFHAWARRYTNADLGLCIGEKDRWGKGYGTEVTQLLLREAFELLNLHKVGWWTFAENKVAWPSPRNSDSRKKDDCEIRTSSTTNSMTVSSWVYLEKITQNDRPPDSVESAQTGIQTIAQTRVDCLQ